MEMTEQMVEGTLNAGGLRIGIIVSRWNEFITKALLEGAMDSLRRQGADTSAVTIASVPGSFEIPVAAQAMAQSGNFDAIVALGCIIRGETTHYDHIASAVTNGIASVTMATGVPISFGVVTTESIEQAIERAGSKAGNKGAEAALVAIEMANLLKKIRV
jgi:6,7-dimethyl-8-ribityllumazine synthase